MRVLLGAFALLAVVACGADAESSSTTGEPEVSTTASPDTSDSTQPNETTTTEPGATATTSDRQQAPDFTLELGEGGQYTLSEGEKPVYLVFWAEW